jgi:hypothetical protein
MLYKELLQYSNNEIFPYRRAIYTYAAILKVV